MTMRSMPPASSHLADRPVPAPPPTMGSPRAILARSRWRICWRAMRGMAALLVRSFGGSGAAARGGGRRDLAPGGDQRIGEPLIVDVQGQAQQLAVHPRPEALLDRS